MLAVVQNIWGIVKPRETESADARLDMRRKISEEFPQQQRQQGQGRRVYDHDLDTISVQSALLFLEGFLEARLGAIHDPQDSRQGLKGWIDPVISSSNQNAGQATQAYQHAAEISKEIKATKSTTKKMEELKMVYHLIQDLRELLDQGIEQLKIDTGASFIEAISGAILSVKATH